MEGIEAQVHAPWKPRRHALDGEIATPVPRMGCAHFCRVAILALNRRKKKAASAVVYPFDCAVADAWRRDWTTERGGSQTVSGR